MGKGLIVLFGSFLLSLSNFPQQCFPISLLLLSSLFGNFAYISPSQWLVFSLSSFVELAHSSDDPILDLMLGGADTGKWLSLLFTLIHGTAVKTKKCHRGGGTAVETKECHKGGHGSVSEGCKCKCVSVESCLVPRCNPPRAIDFLRKLLWSEFASFVYVLCGTGKTEIIRKLFTALELSHTAVILKAIILLHKCIVWRVTYCDIIETVTFRSLAQMAHFSE